MVQILQVRVHDIVLEPHRPDHPVADLYQERIQRQPILGGLINEYERA
jgi:putative transposase